MAAEVQVGRTGLSLKEMQSAADPEAAKAEAAAELAKVVQLDAFRKKQSASVAETAQPAQPEQPKAEAKPEAEKPFTTPALEALNKKLAKTQRDRAKSPLLQPQTGESFVPAVETQNALTAGEPWRLIGITERNLRLGTEIATAWNPFVIYTSPGYRKLEDSSAKLMEEAFGSGGHVERLTEAVMDPDNHPHKQMARDRAPLNADLVDTPAFIAQRAARAAAKSPAISRKG